MVLGEVDVLDYAVVGCSPLLWSKNTGVGDSFGDDIFSRHLMIVSIRKLALFFLVVEDPFFCSL